MTDEEYEKLVEELNKNFGLMRKINKSLKEMKELDELLDKLDNLNEEEGE